MTENLRRGRSAKKVIVNTGIKDPSSNNNVEEVLDKFLNYQKTVEEAIEKIKKENVNLAKNVYIKIESFFSEVNKKLQFFESNLSQFQPLVQNQSQCQPQFKQPLLPLLQTQLQPNPQPQLQPILQPQLQPILQQQLQSISQPHLLPIPQSQPQSIPQSQVQSIPQSQVQSMPQSQFQSIPQPSQVDFNKTAFNQNLQNITSEKLNLTNIDSWIFSIEIFLSSSNFLFMLNRRPINDQEVYLDKYIFNILFFNIEESFRQKIILRSDFVFDLLANIKNFNQPHINNFREDIISQLTSLCFQANELHKFNSKFLNIVYKYPGAHQYLNEQFLIGIYLNLIKSSSYVHSQVSDYVNSNPGNILTLKQVMRIALRYGKQYIYNFNRNFNSNSSSFFNDTTKKAISKRKKNKNIKDLKTKNFIKQNDNVILKKYQDPKNVINNTESTLNFTKNSLKAFNISIKPKTKSSLSKSINSTIQLDVINDKIDIKPKIEKITSSSSKQNNQVSSVFNEIDIKPDIKILENNIFQENVHSTTSSKN